MQRTLSLRRDVLTELDARRLRDVAGGVPSQLGSCLDYVSCHLTDCVEQHTERLTPALQTLEGC